MVLEADEKAWCTLTAEANNKVLGKRLGKELAGVKKALAKLDADALWPLLEVSVCDPVEVKARTRRARSVARVGKTGIASRTETQTRIFSCGRAPDFWHLFFMCFFPVV